MAINISKPEENHLNTISLEIIYLLDRQLNVFIFYLAGNNEIGRLMSPMLYSSKIALFIWPSKWLWFIFSLKDTINLFITERKTGI